MDICKVFCDWSPQVLSTPSEDGSHKTLLTVSLVSEREHGFFPELSYTEVLERLERSNILAVEKESHKPLSIQEM